MPEIPVGAAFIAQKKMAFFKNMCNRVNYKIAAWLYVEKEKSALPQIFIFTLCTSRGDQVTSKTKHLLLHFNIIC